MPIKMKRIPQRGAHQIVDKKEINAAFNEGSNALYMVVQMICPECNKLIRVCLLTNAA